MKSRISTGIIPLILALLLTSCKEKEYNVDFSIENFSNESIEVVLQKTEQSSIDTNLISNGQYFTFHVEMGTGQTAEDYVFSLEELPVHFINVRNEARNEALCNVMQLPCWSRLQPGPSKEFRSVILRINPNSF